MIDLVFSFVQAMCVVAYLYGAWLVISFKAGSTERQESPRVRPAAPHHDEADQAASRRYLALDL